MCRDRPHLLGALAWPGLSWPGRLRLPAGGVSHLQASELSCCVGHLAFTRDGRGRGGLYADASSSFLRAASPHRAKAGQAPP